MAPQIGSQLSELLVTTGVFPCRSASETEWLQTTSVACPHWGPHPEIRCRLRWCFYGRVLLAEDTLLLVALRTRSCTRALRREVKVKLLLHTLWRYRLWESERITPLYINLVTRYGWYFQAPAGLNLLNGGLGEHQNRSEGFKEEKNFAPALRLSRP